MALSNQERENPGIKSHGVPYLLMGFLLILSSPLCLVLFSSFFSGFLWWAFVPFLVPFLYGVAGLVFCRGGKERFAVWFIFILSSIWLLGFLIVSSGVFPGLSAYFFH